MARYISGRTKQCCWHPQSKKWDNVGSWDSSYANARLFLCWNWGNSPKLKIKVKLCSQNLEGWRNTVERKLRLLDKFKYYSDLQGIITEHEFITLLQEEHEISTFLLIMFVYHFWSLFCHVNERKSKKDPISVCNWDLFFFLELSEDSCGNQMKPKCWTQVCRAK